jgi:hypothetical protein
METYRLKNHILNFDEETHTYLVDNIVVPSVTGILQKTIFKDKYKNVDKGTLERAGTRGTKMHKAIEVYEKEGVETSIPELRSYKLIKRLYNFKVIYSEIPIIIEYEGKVLCAGKLDQIIDLQTDDKEIRCVNDFKRTASFDLEYLSYQETLYAIGYEQCYDDKIEKLYGTHLRNDKKQFKEILRIDDKAMELLKEYCEKNKVENFLI